MQLKQGACRYCLVMGKFAFKFPKPTDLETFYLGLLCNISEAKIWRRSPLQHRQLFCPVWFSLFGLVLVMPKVAMLADRDKSAEAIALARRQFEAANLPTAAEAKFVNLGYYQGCLVSVDYANYYLIA